jgi:hypothetical protein
MPGISFDTATTALGLKCTDWAENWIKGKLSKRYDITSPPFTVHTTTSQLTSLAEQMAMGYLYKQISRGSKESIARGDALLEDAKEAVMMIANYECDLLDASLSTSVVNDKSTRVEIISSSSSYHTTFNEDDALNWGPDSDKIKDIANDRL